MIDFDMSTAEIIGMGRDDHCPKKAAPRYRNLNELPAVKEYLAYMAARKKSKPSKNPSGKAIEIAA